MATLHQQVKHYQDGQFCGGCTLRWDEHPQPTASVVTAMGRHKPTPKPVVIDLLIMQVTGKDREQTIHNDKCMTCDDPDMDFHDGLSVKEYTISGLCQRCQDKVF